MIRRHAGIKALRVTKRRATRNAQVRRTVRKAISVTRKAVAAGKAPEARESLKKMASQLDRAVKAGVVHARTAARYKSRLTNAVNKLAKAATT
ncbi:MAG: 30S ribosomal protein S20 [Candidatus Andersenbacteria bacterium]